MIPKKKRGQSEADYIAVLKEQLHWAEERACVLNERLQGVEEELDVLREGIKKIVLSSEESRAWFMDSVRADVEEEVREDLRRELIDRLT